VANWREKLNSKKSDEIFYCNRCGNKHKQRSCPAFGKTCNKCGKKGHFIAKCKSKREVNIIQEEEYDFENSLAVGCVKRINKSNEDWTETVKVNNIELKAKIDTGAQ